MHLSAPRRSPSQVPLNNLPRRTRKIRARPKIVSPRPHSIPLPCCLPSRSPQKLVPGSITLPMSPPSTVLNPDWLRMAAHCPRNLHSEASPQRKMREPLIWIQGSTLLDLSIQNRRLRSFQLPIPFPHMVLSRPSQMRKKRKLNPSPTTRLIP